MHNKFTIHYLATTETKEHIIAQLKAMYEDQGYLFTPLDTQQIPDPLEYLLVVEPFAVNGNYYAVSQIWKNWLFKYRKSTRLIVATFAQGEHENLLSLLSLPPQLTDTLSKLKPVGAYMPQYVGTKVVNGRPKDDSIDTWPIKLPHTGAPSLHEIRRFHNGHDRSRSFSAQLIQLKRLLNDGEQLSNKSFQTHFHHLIHRWEHYQGLFKYLPLQVEFSHIRDTLTIIEKHLQEDGDASANANPELTNKLQHVSKIVKEDIQPIIYPLDYW